MRVYFIAICALFILGAKPYEKRKIFIPSRAAEVLRNFSKDTLYIDGHDMALIEMNDDEVEELSTYIHELFGSCGGFFDVTDDLANDQKSGDIFSSFKTAFKFSPFTAPVPVIYDQRISQLISKTSQDALRNFLNELTAFDDRSANSDNGTKAADFLFARASSLGERLPGFTVQKIATRGYPKQPSVVASLAGTNPALPHIVVGGHMDTLSYDKPGADDDGSGSAVVMEALRIIAANEMRFQRTIDFMWYAAEERGLVGSSSVVKNYKDNGVKVDAAMQFDMTGWVNPTAIHDVYLTDDYTDAGLNQTLEDLIRVYMPDISVGHAECGYACSDHASWTAGHVPAVYPFESHHDDYNRRIHTRYDDMDYLTFEHIDKFAKIALAFLGQMANVE